MHAALLLAGGPALRCDTGPPRRRLARTDGAAGHGGHARRGQRRGERGRLAGVQDEQQAPEARAAHRAGEPRGRQLLEVLELEEAIAAVAGEVHLPGRGSADQAPGLSCICRAVPAEACAPAGTCARGAAC